MNWLIYALMTVLSWGLYGIFLHNGQTAMNDKSNALFKSFLFVGLAYFLTAVLAPLVVLMTRKNMSWNMPMSGMGWSLVAGIVGAIGAFCVLLAFNVGGKPGVVMSIVFAGAPIVNAVTALVLHPPKEGWGSISPLFYLGIVLAASGGFMVTKFKPAAAPAPAAQAAAATPGAASAH